MLQKGAAQWKGLYIGYRDDSSPVRFASMDELEASLTFEQADSWCTRHCGDICYINEQAVMDSLDEELWGNNPDKADARKQFDEAVQRLHNAEEFNR